MMKYAREKVDSIVGLYKELNDNLKDEMLQLEKILLDTKINAEFDPDSEEDIKWVTGEVEKILAEVPMLKKLEDKLDMASDVSSALDAAVEGLESVTNISKMIPARKEINLKKAESDEGAEGDKKANGTKNETAGEKKEGAKDGEAKSDAKKDAKGDAKKEDAKKDDKKEEKKDEKKEPKKEEKKEEKKAAVQQSTEQEQ